MATKSETTRKGCPWLGSVQAHLDHRLPPDREQEFCEHVEGCSTCRAELDSLTEIRAALVQAAQQPLPPMDREAIAARLFDDGEAEHRRSGWLLPAGALAATAAAVLLVLVFWPQATPVPVDAPETVTPIPQAPLGVPLEPARVTYLSGSVEGPHPGETGWTLPLGQTTRVALKGGLAVRLDPDTAVAAMDGSRFQVDWHAGWEVRLEQGALAARLAAGRPHRFRVHCPAGTLEALGTSFSLETGADDTVEIALSHGRLRLESGGRTEELVAPATASWSASGLRDVSRQAPERWALLDLAQTYDPNAPGPYGTLALTSTPEVARVMVDGRTVGDTPLVLALPAGERHLEVIAPGRKTYEARVALETDRLIAHHAGLAPAPAEAVPTVDPPVDPVAQARRHLAARRVAAARKLLDRHLVDHPEDARALLLAADAERIAGRPGPALDAYLRVTALANEARIAEAALFQAGLLRLHTLERPAEALATFQALRRDHPKGLLRQEVAFHLAECYLATGDYRRAARALSDYLRLYAAGTKAAEARALLDDLERKGWK